MWLDFAKRVLIAQKKSFVTFTHRYKCTHKDLGDQEAKKLLDQQTPKLMWYSSSNTQAQKCKQVWNLEHRRITSSMEKKRQGNKNDKRKKFHDALSLVKIIWEIGEVFPDLTESTFLDSLPHLTWKYGWLKAWTVLGLVPLEKLISAHLEKITTINAPMR